MQAASCKGREKSCVVKGAEKCKFAVKCKCSSCKGREKSCVVKRTLFHKSERFKFVAKCKLVQFRV